MSDNGKRGRKRGRKPGSAAAKRSKRSGTSSSDDMSDVSETLSGGDSHLPPIDEEPATKLPEQLLKTMYKEPGVLLIAGMVSWDLVGKRETNKIVRTHPNLNVFHKFTDRKYRYVVSGCQSAHSILIGEDGKIYTFGRNSSGQLGHGDTNTRHVPELVRALEEKNIILAAAGKNHSLFLTDEGIVYACGENKSGQCGVGNTTPTILTPKRINYRGAPIVKVGCGGDFSMILDCNGNLHSFGHPDYSQLGHNTDGQYFITANKLAYDCVTSPKKILSFMEKEKTPLMEHIEIVDFSCGANHTVAIDSKKRAFSWGFGGFGRLGHAQPKNEKVPRLIKYFDANGRGVRAVFCGTTYSLAIGDNGLYMFGQTKRTGEANMYPKPVHDLSGWNIRDIGASNTSIMISADNALIAWGAAPTYGELGTGDLNRSSAKPIQVNKMDDMEITQVTMGFSHTLLICNNQSEEVQAKLAKMPEFKP